MRRLFRFIALAASLAAFPADAQERQVYSLPQGAHRLVVIRTVSAK